MSNTTGIAWTDRTWNPVVGCTKVSQGCKHCYAKTLHDQRHKAFTEGKLQNIPQYAQPFETVQTLPGRLTDPLGWRKPSRVFVNSVSDLFHEDVPDEFIDRVFAIMYASPRHAFQILTKRPSRMLAYMTERETPLRMLVEHVVRIADAAIVGSRVSVPWPLQNVWIGVSVESQAAANERIPLLLRTPAAIRFLSCEPLLGPVSIADYLPNPRTGGCDGGRPREDCEVCSAAMLGIDWVIVGGESGRDARPMELDWARTIRDECADAEVAFFLKQLGGASDPRAHDKAILDGQLHTAMPLRAHV